VLQRVVIDGFDVPIELEAELIGAGERLIVFLHEGLGSLAGWGDWPRTLCAASNCRGLVFSRYGYGRSQRRPRREDMQDAPDQAWPFDYLGVEARGHLPALLTALGIDPAQAPPVLFGHSDGAAIALQYAAAFPQSAAAIIVLAPHLFVEPIARARIEQLRMGWRDGRLRARLARLHNDPEGVFTGWSGCWTAPAFQDWNISAELEAIRCPTLAVQGTLDQYGSLAQLAEIRRRVPQAELLVLDGCRHVAHEERPEEVCAAVIDFLSRLPRRE
jgi:pimeloyl-ACP methyl ester carboxylesterase